MMKKEIGFSGFCDAFRDADRNDNFSYEAKRLLFDYLESIAEESVEEYCLDVIALCCEFEETPIDEIVDNYGIEYDDIRELPETVEAYLNERTIVVGKTSSSCFVFGGF